jgi:hypothetical protein
MTTGAWFDGKKVREKKLKMKKKYGMEGWVSLVKKKREKKLDF